jgi:glycine oxidase
MASSLRASALPDVCIAGAGLIGLSLALELHASGLSVTVLDSGQPLAQASTAAAGMLAASDPENPPALQPLSDLSRSLYPAFLARIESLSGLAVPLQTSRTLQALRHPTPETLTPSQLAALCPALTPRHPFVELHEHSLDPRQLASALLAAVRNTSIHLRPNTRSLGARPSTSGITVETSTAPVEAGIFVDCTGAWAQPPIAPRKGQLLYVEPPAGLDLACVVRTHQVYIVPRTAGPNAGRLLIGATLEDAGFDIATSAEDLARLQSLAAELLPPLAHARIVESWAGLRPATPDALPLIGQLAPRHFIAGGHFRNGILLAPATARVLAQLLSSQPTSAPLAAYAPDRFHGALRSWSSTSDIRPLEP